MIKHRHIVSLLAGVAITMVSPAPLEAATTLAELQNELTHYSKQGEDALTFRTAGCRAMVLADSQGSIGAVLIHSITRRNSPEALVRMMSNLITHGERPVLRFSEDKHSAMLIYPEICKREAGNRKDMVSARRLTVLHNIFSNSHGSCTPYRWHESGISFRLNQSSGQLLCEITPDMSATIVEYVEIRLPRDARSALVPAITGHDHGPRADARQLRMLSASLGGATVISNHPADATFLTRKTNVFCLGTQTRLQEANTQRTNANHYIFPSLRFPNTSVDTPTPETYTDTPQGEQASSTPSDTPSDTPSAEPSAPAVPMPTPEEARREYIRRLQEM